MKKPNYLKGQPTPSVSNKRRKILSALLAATLTLGGGGFLVPESWAIDITTDTKPSVDVTGDTTVEYVPMSSIQASQFSFGSNSSKTIQFEIYNSDYWTTPDKEMSKYFDENGVCIKSGYMSFECTYQYSSPAIGSSYTVMMTRLDFNDLESDAKYDNVLSFKVGDTLTFDGTKFREYCLINSSTTRLSNVSTPISAYDAANKSYTDTQDATTLTAAKTYVDEEIAKLGLTTDVSLLDDLFETTDTTLDDDLSEVSAASVFGLDSEESSATPSSSAKKVRSVSRAPARTPATTSDTTATEDIESAVAEVTAGYTAADAATLSSSKAYTDEREAAITTTYKAADEETLSSAKNYTDTKSDAVTKDYQAADLTLANAISSLAQETSVGFNTLNSRISSVESMTKKGIAGAAALAALSPLDYDPDNKWDFAAGVGSFKGTSATAVGAYYRPNENVMFQIGGAFGNGENMWNAGVSVKLGSGSANVVGSKAAMAATIKKQGSEIAEQREEIEMMKRQMAELAAKVK